MERSRGWDGSVTQAEERASRLVNVRRNIVSMVCVKYKLEVIFRPLLLVYILCVDIGYAS